MTILERSESGAGELEFPPNFIWGAGTAAYQIEGGAYEDGRGESIWDRFCATPGKTLKGENGAVACDHYHRWREDIGLMQQLGLPAYRFSISWPRIVPAGWGQINSKGLDFYDRLVDGLLEAGITPYATLYHWDLPQALQDQGGWPNRQTAYAFAEYAQIVLKRLGDRVKGWFTHNEPWCVAFLGHQVGRHAPGLTEPKLAIAATHHLLLSHGLVVPLIRQLAPHSQASISLNLGVFEPARRGTLDEVAVERADCEQNRLFLDPLFKGRYPQELPLLNELYDQLVRPGDLEAMTAPLDFLGINYYYRSVLEANPASPTQSIQVKPAGTYTTMGWEVYPPGLYRLLTRLNRDYPSRYIITENGASTPDQIGVEGQVVDELRLQYIQEHLKQAARAIREGVKLEGYFVWSLLDNFEWAFGYERRFGIIYVDYATQNRIVKESGKWYSQLIRTHP
ncbi:MAG TPA: GH1 family beta-glucosidase [Chloroflexia bacterium]|nr:GH1 family beta-glucosidase [Chloroflexia bacterium]